MKHRTESSLATKSKHCQRLVKDILHHKAKYYQGYAEISDQKYDRLEAKLRDIDPDHPALQVVGTQRTDADKLPHDTRMLSLDKTYDLQELKKWMGDKSLVSTYKIDGSSCSIIYQKGKLVLAKTRGDGEFGENVTPKVRWIQDIPQQLTLKNGEIRGEIYCDKQNFSKLSKEMAQLKMEKPTGRRNIVAGLLGRKKNLELCRYLKFFAFEIITNEMSFNTEREKIERLKQLGFQVPKEKLHENFDHIPELVKEMESFIAKGSYLVDGLVFSYNDLALRQELGSTAHHPRFKLAFKLQGELQETKIKKITWSVSRNGHLIPVAQVQSVRLSGAEISKVTLHNYGLVKKHKLKVGDTIRIVRSGEVIPKFIATVKSSEEKFMVPKKCPSCDKRVRISSVHLSCCHKECMGKNSKQILNFIQKIGIENLSSKRLDAMLDAGLIGNIADLYEISASDLLVLEKTQDKLANKIYLEIKKSKKTNLAIFMSALGISGGAYNKCQRIVDAGFNTIEKIRAMELEDLCQVELFAKKSANSFIASLNKKWPLVDELLALGFEFKAIKVKQSVLTGRKLVITGTLTRKRDDIEKEIKLHGGTLSNAVSKTTDYLVTNDQGATSTKAKRAQQLKIEIISEDELKTMIKK